MHYLSGNLIMSTNTPLRRRRKRIPSRNWLDWAPLLALVASFLLLVMSFTQFKQPLDRAQPSADAMIVMTLPTPNSVVLPLEMITPVQVAGVEQPTGAEMGNPTMTPIYQATATPMVMTTSTLVPVATTTFSASPQSDGTPKTVAILAGHRNNDSGAICEIAPYEGLQEVDVTTEVSAHLVRLLTEAGYTVLDLDEFDSRIDGLVADAFVSIHADSCVDWEGTTGYKAARVHNSFIPEIEDYFIYCVEKEYGALTGLSTHPGSITHSMTSYHAFRKVHVYTPAIIMEIGFLYYDHDLLTQQPELVAEGIKRGIACFLNEELKVEEEISE